jgi:hypothetical protein
MRLPQTPHTAKPCNNAGPSRGGGITQTLTVPLPLNAWQLRITSPEVVAEIDRLLDHNTNLQIASLLNDRGLRSAEGKSFTAQIVARIRRRSGLTSRYDRLRKAGMLTVKEMAVVLGISPQSVKIWNRHGLLRSHACNDKNDCLFEHPGKNPPRKAQGRKLSERRLVNEIVAPRPRRCSMKRSPSAMDSAKRFGQ